MDGSDTDLIKATQEVQILNGHCVVVVELGRVGINAMIASAGVKFFYSDGTDYTDGPRNVNIPEGGNAAFYSDDGAKCVKQWYCVMVATAPNYKPYTFETRDAANEGECIISAVTGLDPKLTISEVSLGDSSLESYLQVSKKR